MADFYVSTTSDDYAASRSNTGSSSSSPWAGVGGIVRALGLVGPGGRILLGSDGTTPCDARLLKKFSYTGLAGSISVNDYAEARVGGVPTGAYGYVVYHDTTAKIIYLHNTAGTWAAGNALYGPSGNAAGTTLVDTMPPVPALVAGTAAEGYVSILGVNSAAAWADDGTQAIIDRGEIMIAKTFYAIKNISLSNDLGTNVTVTAGPFIAENIFTDGSSLDAFTLSARSILRQCHLKATRHAVNSSAGILVDRCHLTGTKSLVDTGGATVINSIIDGGVGLETSVGLVATGNTIDGCSPGISVTGGSATTIILHNRITNCPTGIQASSASLRVFEDYNLFYSSSFADRENVHAGQHSQTATTLTQQGYVDQGYDYTLTEDALLRRAACPIDSVHTAYLASGLSPDDAEGEPAPAAVGGISKSRLIGGV